MSWYVVCLSVVVLSAACAHKFERNLIFTINAGESTCFVKQVARNKIIEVVYKVVKVAGGERAVSFSLLAPRRRRSAVVAVHARRWPAGAHVLRATLTGAYRFCFDNSFDLYSKKTIFFDISIHSKTKNHKMSLEDFALVNDNLNYEVKEAGEAGSMDYGGLRSWAASRLRDNSLDVDRQFSQERQLRQVVIRQLRPQRELRRALDREDINDENVLFPLA